MQGGLQRVGCLNWDHVDFQAISENVGLKEKAQKDMSQSGNSLPHIFSVWDEEAPGAVDAQQLQAQRTKVQMQKNITHCCS